MEIPRYVPSLYFFSSFSGFQLKCQRVLTKDSPGKGFLSPITFYPAMASPAFSIIHKH